MVKHFKSTYSWFVAVLNILGDKEFYNALTQMMNIELLTRKRVGNE